MSISYSGLVSYGKSTLPSVDSWGTNMNILRDPPKSITTRKINKVLDTSQITTMIDEATDRASESILPFARGINPCVAVSYNNYGGNGGQNNVYSGNSQAYLPYTIMKDGAFRPPLFRQENITPLSRLPRNWTKAFTQPGFVDFSKKMITCGTAEQTKEVKNNILKTNVVPTAYYRIEKPIDKPNEVKYHVKDVLNAPYSTNMSSSGNQTIQENIEPTRGINQNVTHIYNLETNMNDPNYYKRDNINFNTERYIQDANAHPVYTNRTLDYNKNSLEQGTDLSNRRMNEKLNVNYTTPVVGIEQTNYIHDDMYLNKNLPNYETQTNIIGNSQQGSKYIHQDLEYDRNVPDYEAYTNNGGGVHKKNQKPEYITPLENVLPRVKDVTHNTSLMGETNISNKNYERLLQKSQYREGGFENRGAMPNRDRVQNVLIREDPEKRMFNKTITENYQGRF